MSFKSIFQKFKAAPKTKNNWLMPFRRSGVKVNLKSIKFDRVGGFSPKKSDIHSSARRPSTLPNLQKVDSFLSNPVSISEMHRDEKLFSKIHDTNKNPIGKGLIFLIVLIIIVLSAGVYLFSINKLKEKDTIVSECLKYVSEQKVKGYNTDLKCEPKLSWLDYPFANTKATTQLDAIKKNINKQIADQQAQLAQLDKDIRSTKQNLASIDPAFEKELPNGSNPVPNTINDKQTLLNNLRTLLAQKDQIINTVVAQFRYLIKITPDTASQPEQDQLNNFDKLAKSEKYSQFSSLNDQFNKFKQKLTSASAVSWFQKSLDNPDLYSYKVLFGDDYKALYDSTTFANTTPPNNDLISITGDDAADRRIIQIAEARGYKKRALASESSLISFGGDKLQQSAKAAFDKLVAGAAEDGIRLGLVSGYRSINEQKSLFTSRFRGESLNLNKGKAYTNIDIVAGRADEAINNVLSASSIPGYSRHHTGYAIDITDLNGKKDFTQFADTAGYKWISANNYFNAKRFGFIPSYPPQASNQGPEPESWEYVYVGVEAVK